MWERLCKALGHEEWLANPKYKSDPDRCRNRDALAKDLNSVLPSKTSQEWIDVLNAAAVPCGPIYSVDQVFADPQVRHLEAAAELEHPRLGRYKVVNQAAKLSRTPAKLVAATPEVGQHTDEILAELGYDAGAIADLRARKAV